MAMLTWMVTMIAVHTRHPTSTDEVDQTCENLVHQGKGNGQEIVTIIGSLDRSWVQCSHGAARVDGTKQQPDGFEMKRCEMPSCVAEAEKWYSRNMYKTHLESTDQTKDTIDRQCEQLNGERESRDAGETDPHGQVDTEGESESKNDDVDMGQKEMSSICGGHVEKAQEVVGSQTWAARVQLDASKAGGALPQDNRTAEDTKPKTLNASDGWKDVHTHGRW